VNKDYQFILTPNDCIVSYDNTPSIYFNQLRKYAKIQQMENKHLSLGNQFKLITKE